MSNIDTSSWKEFRIGDLFDVDGTWEYGKNKAWKSKFDCAGKNRLPVISGTTVNNGVNYYTEDIPEKGEIYSNCCTMNTRGESGTVFYHDGEFLLANNILTMPMPDVPKKAQLFIGAMLQKMFHSNDYSTYPTKNQLKDAVLLLPAIVTEEPDYEYMEKYIAELEAERVAELEAERVAELEAYLSVSGLDDYELTEEDIRVLSLSLSRSGSEQSAALAAGQQVGTVNWKEFRVGDLFTSQNGNFDLKQEHINGEGIDVVSSGESNMGIIGKSDIDARIIPANTITVDMFGNVYYREFHYKMVTHARVFSLEPKATVSKETLIYIVGALKNLKQLFSYTNMCSFRKIQNLPICLPATQDGDPDHEYMESYIRAQEKIAIKDAVLLKDRIIEETRRIAG